MVKICGTIYDSVQSVRSGSSCSGKVIIIFDIFKGHIFIKNNQVIFICTLWECGSSAYICKTILYFFTLYTHYYILSNICLFCIDSMFSMTIASTWLNCKESVRISLCPYPPSMSFAKCVNCY